MHWNFQDRRVLVTGASKGIGAATALMFGQAKGVVGVHFHSDRKGAEEIASQIRAGGAKAVLLSGDLRREDDCRSVIASFVKETGGLDVLVNNAGAILKRAPAETVDAQTFDETMRLNVTSAFVCTREAIPHLRQSAAPAVVLLTSVASRIGPPNAAAYAAAKAALNGLTMSLARELASDRIRVNAVSPGVIDTPFHAATPKDRLRELSEMILLKRLGTAAEVASAILFLAGDTAAYITGACLDVNGGMHLRC
jgi:3-oxoacyl-[acyl-carrier protein] reductase